MDFLSVFIRGIIQNLSTRYGKIIAAFTVLVIAGIFTIDSLLGQTVCDAAGQCVDFIQNGLRQTLSTVKGVLVTVAGLLGLSVPPNRPQA